MSIEQDLMQRVESIVLGAMKDVDHTDTAEVRSRLDALEEALNWAFESTDRRIVFWIEPDDPEMIHMDAVPKVP